MFLLAALLNLVIAWHLPKYSDQQTYFKGACTIIAASSRNLNALTRRNKLENDCYGEKVEFSAEGKDFINRYAAVQSSSEFQGQNPIYKCIEKATGKMYLCKHTFTANTSTLPIEIEVLKALNYSKSPYFVPLHEYFHLAEMEYVEVMEFYNENWADLYEIINFLHRNSRTFDRKAIFMIFEKVVDGIIHLHDIGYAHNDIKSKVFSNISRKYPF